jgi:antirestriction protein ArdC
MAKIRLDPKAVIADKIMTLIKEKELLPWQMPYIGMGPTNLETKAAYKGINFVYLGLLCIVKEYSTGYFLTYKQAQKVGGNVKKGEKGHYIIKYNPPIIDDDGEIKSIPWYKLYTVFNLDQCENLEAPFREESLVQPCDKADKLIADYTLPADGPKISYGGYQAYYQPSVDKIQIPNRKDFHVTEQYYGTVFHEMAHSTGHPSRLCRKGITDIWMRNMHRYSYEELIAEFTSAMLANQAGLATDKLVESSAAYIKSWNKYFEQDPKKIVEAASEASKAADFIIGKKK